MVESVDWRLKERKSDRECGIFSESSILRCEDKDKKDRLKPHRGILSVIFGPSGHFPSFSSSYKSSAYSGQFGIALVNLDYFWLRRLHFSYT